MPTALVTRGRSDDVQLTFEDLPLGYADVLKFSAAASNTVKKNNKCALNRRYIAR